MIARTGLLPIADRSAAATVLVFGLFLALGAPPAHATDPEELCTDHDTLISQLTGKPHFERQALLLKDEIPSQRHRLELFINAGEGGRHTYSLLRTRRNDTDSCMVSAGLVQGRRTDTYGHPHIVLKDENDPETFDFVGCEDRYVMIRKTSPAKLGKSVDVCENMEALAHTPRLIVSYGRIAEDHRKEIPWPK